jgi:endonuclease/exonuclease/phosphatase family metal-dependent hydrolase
MPTSVARAVPPVLLVALTVLFTVLTVGPAPAVVDHPPRTASTGPVGARPATVDELGVVSFNAYQDLPLHRAWRDAVALTSRADVDVIGWQEMDRFGVVLARLEARGFDSQTFPGRASEVAVSWRRSVFEPVSAEPFLMHETLPGTRFPIPRRYVTRVALRHRASGRVVTVLNTHANHKIEDLDRPGRPLRTANARMARVHFRKLRALWLQDVGDLTVGTGDLNVDHGPDQRVRYWGFPAARLAGLAMSSWQALGWRDRRDTFTAMGQHRKIDYVFLARRDRGVDASFVRQRVLTGFASDHQPLLAVLALHPGPPGPEVTDAAAP